jgi:GH15 family glucan-1,4-alpha-glucosidase
LTLAFSTAVPLSNDGHGGVTAEFVLSEGKSQVFTLRDDCNEDGVPCLPSEKEAGELLRDAVKFWQEWLSACTYHGRWRDQVRRSALALKLLTFEPAGAIVAALTTSLPEVIGGKRNWDYRYTGCAMPPFRSMHSFVSPSETKPLPSWDGLKITHPSMHAGPKESGAVVFAINGEKKLPEHTLRHSEGYRGPVQLRIGNGAGSRFQGDIYGELMDAFYLSNKYVSPTSYDVWVKIRAPLE